MVTGTVAFFVEILERVAVTMIVSMLSAIAEIGAIIASTITTRNLFNIFTS
jgi:hypothetical protein